MEERRIPGTGELYRHFKDKLYQIVAVATHSETGEQMVVYQALYGDFRVYVRPLAMFLSEVDHEKYPQAAQKYRFEQVKPAALQEASRMEAEAGGKAEEASRMEAEADVRAEEATLMEAEAGEQSLLIGFLDADSYTEKLNRLRGMKKKIDDKMACDIAVSLDIVLDEKKPLEEKIEDLESCLKTYARFECGRLR